MDFLFEPGFRLAAGVLFFVLFGWLYFKISRGTGKVVFLLLSLLLVVSFWFVPIMLVIAWFGLGMLLFWDGLRRRSGRPGYLPAGAIVEGGGIKRGLTPPEAAIVLEMPLSRVLTVVLTGLLKKGVLELASEIPVSLRVNGDFQARRSAPDVQGRNAFRRMAAQKHNVLIHPYEEPFLELLEGKEGQPLSMLNFTVPMRALLRHTARRMGGYDLAGTREYYRKHLGRARHDVALASRNLRASTGFEKEYPVSASTASDAHRIMEHHLEWVILDETLREYYRDFHPRWLPWHAEGFLDWVVSLEKALLQSIPTDGLVVSAGDSDLIINWQDPVSEEFFKAVYNQVWGT